MSQIEALIKEFEHEAQTTRKHVERLPDDQLGWRPHEKSFTAGALASHFVDCIRWADAIFSADELDMDPATYKPYSAKSASDLLKTFDEEVTNCGRVLQGVTDEMLTHPWTVKVNGRPFFTKPKSAAFRDIILSHLIHHRGQFSVYLRLLNIPVPGSYGPSADEPFDM